MPAKKATRKKATRKKVTRKAPKKKVARKAPKKKVARKAPKKKVTPKKATEKIKTAAATVEESPPISALREELDTRRRTNALIEDSKPYWMVCPKCGGSMKEIEYRQVKIDKCTECQGVYFDRGELDLVIRQFDKKGFITRLRNIF